MFQLLKEKYGNEKATQKVNMDTGELSSIFDGWKGFTGYFKKFFETRKNFYKSDGTSTAIATRIVDQNLNRFFDNITLYKLIKDKLDLSAVESHFGLNADDVFSLDFYNKCLTQKGIDTYNYFLGGETLENGEKKQGVNEIINKYKQDHKGEKIAFLKKLDKQILSEKETGFFVLANDEQALELLKEFQINSEAKISKLKDLISNFTNDQDAFDLTKIYISATSLNTISHKWVSDSKLFQDPLYLQLKAQGLMKSKGKNEEEYKFPDFISLSDIQTALKSVDTKENFWKESYSKIDSLDLKRNTDLWNNFLKILKFEFQNNFDLFFEKNTVLKLELTQESVNLQKIKIQIKEFADATLWTYQLGRYFALEKKRSWDETYEVDVFYTDPDNGYMQFYEDAYDVIVKPYNHIRNYLTKKPFSEEKWKLNFENPTLADGWDKNKESDNTTVILKKDGKFFIAIMKKGSNKIFDDKNKDLFRISDTQNSYQKLVYKLFPDPSKMMPKVCFSKKGLDFFKPSDEIMRIYKNNEFKKGPTFSLSSMHKLIEFYIDCLGKYSGWVNYNFSNIKSPNAYQENIGEFYADVAEAGYEVFFETINAEYIEKQNNEGKLYLFEIFNQDFSDGKTGSKNLHTMYFEELFSAANKASNFNLKLNGQAEIFYRPKSIEEESEKRNFSRDIIKNKRYTENKIFFHVPITLNRVAKSPSKFNVEIDNFLANNPDINIIGIDRGEKHLAYFSVINQKGEVLNSGSLNIVGKGKDGNGVNYAEKLENKAKDRELARQDWQVVEGIKDLKKGYISQIVRQLADFVIKYNAIIVMEDLNMRFKQIRGGIEKSIYQQLEKALIDKLNFLVSKGEKDPQKAGHVLKAYQLTAPFESFKDMGKQTGIVFYTQASYTSKIDPLTGWRPHLYLKYRNAEDTKKQIAKFDSIIFNSTKNRFEFTYDLTKFVENSRELPTKTVWTVCSNVERLRWDKTLNNNKGDYKHYSDLTEQFKELFENYNIDITGNILDKIRNIEPSKNERFFKDFIYYFTLIFQIRNTAKEKEGNENDFILSPVEPFFDSRNSKDFKENLPENGDDNGAYNIARKGILILRKISEFYNKNGNCEKLKWDNLYISQTEWDNFVQNKTT